jgi:hypothetical protein
MPTGLVLDGVALAVPGFNVTNFLDNPKLRLSPNGYRIRSSRERAWVHLIVVHTTGGIPGGTDHRAQVIIPGFGPSTNAGERVVAMWKTGGKPAGAHLLIDFDGKIYCCADLVTEAAFHAEHANGCSVGIEVVQGHNAELYQAQIDLTARFIYALCAIMPVSVQRQIPKAYTDQPIPRFVTSQQQEVPLANVVGIVGHRDLTASRGEGDPGNPIMNSLATVGCESFDFGSSVDLTTWKARQATLGIAKPDGVPGPQTVAALKAAGYPDGIWVRSSPSPTT